jgi:hypothetical protein
MQQARNRRLVLPSTFVVLLTARGRNDFFVWVELLSDRFVNKLKDAPDVRHAQRLSLLKAIN